MLKVNHILKRTVFQLGKKCQALSMHLCCPYLATFKTNFLKTYLTIQIRLSIISEKLSKTKYFTK